MKVISPKTEELFLIKNISVEDSGGEDSRDQNPYYCRHCSTSSSKDWHHGGKDMKLLCTNCRQHYKRYGEMPLLPGMVRDGREFSFRPISPEGLTGGPEDVDSDGRGLDNRLSPADRGKIFYKSFVENISTFPFSSWRGERQWPELHELQERVRVSESGGRQSSHNTGSYRAGQAGRARDLQRCRQ